MQTDKFSEMIILDDSLQALKDRFNSHRQSPRFLALLSPTWPGWSVQGARAVQASIINKFPHADICISIVWIKKLSGDSEQTAQKAAAMFKDHRVVHFYDSNQSSGKAIANRLGWAGRVAWDIYLFYEVGVEWANTAPQPAYWMHQLKDRWAHKAHFRTGDGLVEELSNAMTKLINRA